MLEIGGPVTPHRDLTPQQAWIALAIILLVLELFVGGYLYRKINHTTATLPPQPATPVDEKRVLETLTPPATTTATTTIKVSLKTLTPPPTPPIELSAKQEQDILKSLTPQK